MKQIYPLHQHRFFGAKLKKDSAPAAFFIVITDDTHLGR
jgi:hypothetical protein